MAQAYTRSIPNGRGFTLLELLVSIVILALIVTISYSALRLGSRSWQGTASIISENSTTRFAVQFIRKKIEQIYPIYWNDGVKKVLAFQGGEDGVKFIAPAPQGRETEEYYEYYITTKEREDNSISLLLYFEPHDPSSLEFKVSDESPYRVLLSKLDTVKYSYYGASASNTYEWNPFWEDVSTDYPSIIKIEINSLERRGPWLDITAEPRSTMNVQ